MGRGGNGEEMVERRVFRRIEDDGRGCDEAVSVSKLHMVD
jgi:hypothetical protein